MPAAASSRRPGKQKVAAACHGSWGVLLWAVEEDQQPIAAAGEQRQVERRCIRWHRRRAMTRGGARCGRGDRRRGAPASSSAGGWLG